MRWVKVKSARKAPGSCDSCKVQIEVGQGYLWSTFYRGEQLVAVRHLRCLKPECRPEDRTVRPWRSHRQATTWTPRRRTAAVKHFIADACNDREDWSTADLYRHYLDQPSDPVIGPMSATAFTWTLRHLGYIVKREQNRNIVFQLSPVADCADVHGTYVR